MGIEVERKFLVANDGWRSAVVREEYLTDGLIASTDDRKVRVRTCGGRATLTVKAKQAFATNAEYEYEIPLLDAEELLARHCGGNILSKTRSFAPHEGFTWQIDVYDGLLAGVILAEIELPRIDCPFPLPPWIGREVTGDPAFRKASLQQARLQDRACVFPPG